MEDIDSPRIKRGADRQAIDDLRWLGLDWDEGPDLGGPHAPYVQTQRLELYRAALDELQQAERVYPCTCTRTDIAAAASARMPGRKRRSTPAPAPVAARPTRSRWQPPASRLPGGFVRPIASASCWISSPAHSIATWPANWATL